MSDMQMQYADGWRPQPGDLLMGKVTDLAVGYSRFGQTYPIVTIHDEKTDRDVAVHGFHAALRARLARLKPRVGERLGVRFVGERPHKTDANMTVMDYVVKVDGRGEENVWAQIDPTPPAGRSDAIDAPAPKSDIPDDDDIPF